jgi:hypothetical protein
MKRPLFVFVMIIVLVGLVFHPGCKTAEDTAQYTLTVTLGEGVNGTPAAGSYNYGENDTVTYSYAAQAGYGNLTVTLDGAPVASSGVITMTGNHILNVTAEVDVRGSWSGNLFWQTGDYYLQVSFSGGILSGVTEGHTDAPTGPGNETGTFTITGNEIEFSLHYYLGTLLFEGTIESSSHMSGTWVTDNEVSNGNWHLDRQI